MSDQPLALTVEQGLHAEQDLLAAVCRGERESGVLFWRPTDHALVMPRRMSRLANFETAQNWRSPVGRYCCVKPAVSRSRSRMPP